MKKIHSEIDRPDIETPEKGMLDCIRGLAVEYGPAYAVATYEGRVLSLKDPELSYYFAKEYEFWADVVAHEQVIIDSKSPMWSTRWIYAFPTTFRLLEHANIVGENGNPEWCYYMAMFFRGKDNVSSTAFRQKVYESKSGKWNYFVAAAFRGIEDIEPHRQAVLNSGNGIYIKQLRIDDENLGTDQIAPVFVKNNQNNNKRKQ